ncbi:MAG: paraquat-inducible protein A [Desulfobacterales bacterium]|nr:paraquat-inducible protein A [Desulfobacterales bacterium]
MDHPYLIRCHDCDLMNQIVELPVEGVARCARCGAVLRRHKHNSLERTLALAVTGVILFILANAFPFLGLELQAQTIHTTLISGVRALFSQGMWFLGSVVLLTTIIVPAVQLMGLLYVLIPLRFNKLPWKFTPFFRYLQELQPWSMMEVFMLGILVSIVKLSKMAEILPGIAAYAFMALIFILAASMAVLDPHQVWEKIQFPSAIAEGRKRYELDQFANCHSCQLLCRIPRSHALPVVCPRCGATLHRRKLNSIARVWALLLAAFIFYFPANMMPITIVTSFGQVQADTILSGVLYFIKTGMWPIALVIFVASVVVPILKLVGLVFLLISVQTRSNWRPVDRTRLYRITELVGRWSMVDIYVVTILVALVHLGMLANIEAGPAAGYFCGVVILTMFAAMSFDPRLIWDNLEKIK